MPSESAMRNKPVKAIDRSFEAVAGLLKCSEHPQNMLKEQRPGPS